MSKKLRIFAHFVRLVTAVCVVKFWLRNKIELYFYKPYLDQLNLWGSIVEITNKKLMMFALIERYPNINKLMYSFKGTFYFSGHAFVYNTLSFVHDDYCMLLQFFIKFLGHYLKCVPRYGSLPKFLNFENPNNQKSGLLKSCSMAYQKLELLLKCHFCVKNCYFSTLVTLK